MQSQAQQMLSVLLDCFEHNQPIEHGWYIEKALRKLPWSQRYSSLKALDAMIQAHRKQRGCPDSDQFLADLDKRNTLLLLAAYLGRVLQHSTGSSATWYAYDDFVAVNPAEHSHIPHHFATAVVLQLGEQWVFPLSMVCDQFFEPSTPYPISQLIENIILREILFQTDNTTVKMQTLQQLILQHGQAPSGMAHQDWVNQLTWDHSLASLNQLETMLTHAKQHFAYTEQTWFDHANEANFLLWASAYLASSLAKATECELSWWNQSETSDLMQTELSHDVATTRVAQIGEHLYFCQGFISDFLLGKNSKSMPDFVDFVLQEAHSKTLLPLSTSSTTGRSTASILWKKALLNAGFLAAQVFHRIINLTADEYILPTLYDGEHAVQILDDGETVEQHWRNNPEQRPYLSLAYEHHAAFATRMLPAIQIDTMIDDGMGEEVMVGIVVAYYPADHYLGLRILKPYYNQTPAQHEAELVELSPYFFEGIQQYESAHLPFWKTYFSDEYGF